jgi:hypothetical protein
LGQASTVVAKNSVEEVLKAMSEIPAQGAVSEQSAVSDALQEIFSQSSVQRAAEVYERIVAENPSLLPREIDALVEAQL